MEEEDIMLMLTVGGYIRGSGALNPLGINELFCCYDIVSVLLYWIRLDGIKSINHWILF